MAIVATYYVVDSRNGNSQGPYSRRDAKQLCADLNDYVQRNMLPEKRKTLRAAQQRPFTFGTELDFAQSGKVIKKAV
jgi:hypothetical protein